MGDIAENWSSPDGGTNQNLVVKILIGGSAAVVVALVAVVALIVTGANGSSENPGAATTTTVTTPSSGQFAPAPKLAQAQPAAESEPVPAAPPVAGGYPGGGGQRPATAEPLPTYVGRYTKLESAHLLTPSGNIGCDFNAPDDSGGQGLCGIVSYNTTSSPLGTERLGGQQKGKWIFPFAANRVGDPTAASGTTGWMNQPMNDGYQVPVAEYGKQYYFNDWVCASEEPGMTCWNTSTGSGVFLSREKAERFDGPAAQAPANNPSGQDADVVLGSNDSITKGLGQARPGIIYFGGDPTGRVMGVTWSSWGGDKAEATGLGNWREEGVGTHEAPATVVAFDVGTCNGKRAYRKAAIYFPQRGETFDPANGVDICFTDR